MKNNWLNSFCQNEKLLKCHCIKVKNIKCQHSTYQWFNINSWNKDINCSWEIFFSQVASWTALPKQYSMLKGYVEGRTLRMITGVQRSLLGIFKELFIQSHPPACCLNPCIFSPFQLSPKYLFKNYHWFSFEHLSRQWIVRKATCCMKIFVIMNLS